MTVQGWRPSWNVRTGDTVVVWKLDRLGRNLWHILQAVKKLTERGVTLVSVTDASTPQLPQAE